MAMGGATLVGMMIVVPAFAVADQADDPIVLAVSSGIVSCDSPHVRHELTLQVMCQTPQSATKTPHTRTLSPNCTPPITLPWRANLPGSRRGKTLHLGHIHPQPQQIPFRRK